MIGEIDSWRIANLMMKRYAVQTQAESARPARELAAVGDHKDAAVWRRVVDAVEELTNVNHTFRPVH